MISRLLASVLALIIGSPTCWCCVPHDMTADTVAKHACCQADEGSSALGHKPVKHQECPCALSLTERGLAEGKAVAPKTFVGEAAPSAELPTSLVSTTGVPRGPLPRLDLSLLWHPPELYQRHCALLL